MLVWAVPRLTASDRRTHSPGRGGEKEQKQKINIRVTDITDKRHESNPSSTHL